MKTPESPSVDRAASSHGDEFLSSLPGILSPSTRGNSGFFCSPMSEEFIMGFKDYLLPCLSFWRGFPVGRQVETTVAKKKKGAITSAGETLGGC